MLLWYLWSVGFLPIARSSAERPSLVRPPKRGVCCVCCAVLFADLLHAGGYVYHGSRFADVLDGHYIFADHSTGWVLTAAQDLFARREGLGALRAWYIYVCWAFAVSLHHMQKKKRCTSVFSSWWRECLRILLLLQACTTAASNPMLLLTSTSSLRARLLFALSSSSSSPLRVPLV